MSRFPAQRPIGGPQARASLAVVLAAEAALAQGPSFQGLGFLPGTGTSIARGVSGDGSTVVGECRGSNASERHAFRWTRADGMQELPATPQEWGIAAAADFDGGVVAGGVILASGVSAAVRWVSSVPESLGTIEGGTASFASAVNADGSVVVGNADSSVSLGGAFRWTASGGMQLLGNLPTGISSYATGVSADGSVVVGNDLLWPATMDRAFRWTLQGGIVDLGGPPGFAGAYALGVSGDGTTTVGWCDLPVLGYRAVRWTAQGPMDLGAVGSSLRTTAAAASWDGSVIVGGPGRGLSGAALIWTAATGMRDLNQRLTELGIPHDGWQLINVWSVSWDGQTLVGEGVDPLGFTEAWVAVLPGSAVCYPNCDGSTATPVLNLLDFGCFMESFAAGREYANCDRSTEPPVLNVLDFVCFLNRFAAGCS